MVALTERVWLPDRDAPNPLPHRRERPAADPWRARPLIRSPEAEEHSAAEAFINSPAVLSLLADVVRARSPEEPAELELTGSALRVIAGPRGGGDAFWFHYDASVVTMVVPIFLPDAEHGSSGELVGLFNKCPFSTFRSCQHHRQSHRTKPVLSASHPASARPPDYLQRVDMEVGNLYLFWGYRSLHGNMPCESGALRVTLLLHFGRPHSSSDALIAAVPLGHRCAPVAKGVQAGKPPSTHMTMSKPFDTSALRSQKQRR